MHPLRTRFKKEIVAEFMPPARYNPKKPQKVIILCSGMPGVPRPRSLMEFLSRKGYWTVNPRYRGSWESGGVFLAKSPAEDVKDVIDGLYEEITDLTWHKKFRINPREIFVIGGSFGGPAAILGSIDPRVKKVIANCPVVDWSVLKKAEKAETANPSYVNYIKDAFGRAYNLNQKNWNKLYSGRFYNPASEIKNLNPNKIVMFHAKDDPVVPWRSVAKFAKKADVKLNLLARGGHLSTEYIVQKYWLRISKFFRFK